MVAKWAGGCLELRAASALASARAPSHRGGTFKSLRIAALLLVLLIVAVGTWRDRVRTTQWRSPLYVGIYPIAADDSAVTRAYIAGLNHETFASIDAFFAREAERHGLSLRRPVKTLLRAEVTRRPPLLKQSAGIPGTLIWSLRLRFWSWLATRRTPGAEDVHVFVLFHDPARTPSVPHSLGLQKGLIGVVYGFAAPDMAGSNAVVIAHELLHTVGASDLYDAETDQPRVPDGLGDPAQVPLYPQRFAEIMGGRRMLSPTRWETPASLDEVRIGPATALAIRWDR